MDAALLAELGCCADDLAFPAAKDEVLDSTAGSPLAAELRWLVEAMPGRWFTFESDLLSTARLSLELDIRRPWPTHAEARGWLGDDSLAAAVQQRLLLCRQTNGHLIRVVARDGVVHLTGRTPDVTGGVMATRAALALTPGGRIVNELDVQA